MDAESMKKTSSRPADRWLIAIVLAAAVGIALLLWWLPPTGYAVEVAVDGQVVATLPLNTPTQWVIPGAEEGENTLVIADGQATVTDASCPDGICVRHPAISRAGESIICLPNRVVITVVGGSPRVDGTTN